MPTYSHQHIVLPAHDNDVFLVFPSGKEVQIQCRPSNADTNYNGSLDIILPANAYVTNWFGDSMEPGQHQASDPSTLLAKQLVTELP